jgi:hypothetical protein
LPRRDKQTGAAWRGQCKLGLSGTAHGSLLPGCLQYLMTARKRFVLMERKNLQDVKSKFSIDAKTAA